MTRLLSTLAAISAVAVLSGAGSAPTVHAAPGFVNLCPGLNSYCATLEVTAADLNFFALTPGSGTIRSTPAGIDCAYDKGVLSGSCSRRFMWPNTSPTLSVTLDYFPAAGNVICIAVAPGCFARAQDSVNLSPGSDSARAVGFGLTKVTYSISRSGDGTGRVLVTSPAGGGSCGPACTGRLDYGTKVTLTAKPDAGAILRGWTGACAGQGLVCTLTLTAATTTNAVFGIAPPPTTTTTTTTQPPPTTTTTTTGGSGPAKDTSVDADLLGAGSARTKLGARAVRVELALRETVGVTLTLSRRGKTKDGKPVTQLLVRQRFATVRAADDRLLTLVVPRRVTKGGALLSIAVGDAVGNAVTFRRNVTVGRVHP